MDYEIERLTPSRVQMRATASLEEVGAEREKIVSKLQRGAHVDGFRRGKVPRALVERRFAEAIRDELQEELVRHAWDQVRGEAKLRPASSLDVRQTQWQEDGRLNVTAEFDVFPEVELATLDGFTPPELELEPSPEELSKALAELAERQGAWEPVEGEPAREGLLVDAEVHGEYPDGGGEPFHEEHSLFQIGRGEVLPEIEAAVAGRNVGDEVTAERILGEEAGAEKVGKRVAYRVVVKGLRRKRLPEVDDAFASSLGISGGLAQLEKAIRDRLRWDKLRQRHEVWRDALVRHLSAGKRLDLPEILVREETREEVVKFAEALAHRGVDPEKTEIDWGKLEQDFRRGVEGRLQAELVLDAAATRLGTEIDDETVDAEIERQARQAGVPFAESKGNLAKRGGVERIRAILRRARAVDEMLRPFEVEAGSDAGTDRR